MPNNVNCKGWCPPTIIYLTLSLVSTAISLVTSHYHDDKHNQGKNKVFYTISHLIGIAFWTSILYWLCSNCHITAAWVVLMLPIILVGFLMIAIFSGGIRGKYNTGRERVTNVRHIYYG